MPRATLSSALARSFAYLWRTEALLHQLLFVPALALIIWIGRALLGGDAGVGLWIMLAIFGMSALAMINGCVEYGLDLLLACARDEQKPVTVHIGHFKFWHLYLPGKRRFLAVLTSLTGLIWLQFWLFERTSVAELLLPLLVFALPAIIMLQCLSENIWHSFNPAAIARCIRLSGWHYLLPLTLCALLLWLLGTTELPALLVSYLSVALWIVNCRLMGELIAAQKEAFGLIDEEAEALRAEREQLWRELRFRLYQLCSADKIDEAEQLLEAQIAEHQLDDDTVQRYLFEDGDGRLAFRHAQHQIDRLLAAGRAQSAWTLLMQVRKLNEHFCPSSEAQLFKLIQAACVSTEQWQRAVELLMQLPLLYPHSAQQIYACNLARKICVQKLDDPIRARQIQQAVAQIRRQRDTEQ